MAGLLLLAAAAAADYRALGTEPFWSVTVTRDRVWIEQSDRAAVSERRLATPRHADGRTYRTRRIAVRVTKRRCSDGMSDRIYPDTVRVTFEGRTLSGCGFWKR